MQLTRSVALWVTSCVATMLVSTTELPALRAEAKRRLAHALLRRHDVRPAVTAYQAGLRALQAGRRHEAAAQFSRTKDLLPAVQP